MQATAAPVPRSPRIVPWSRMGDEALAGRAAAGDQAAFAALYERYHGPLLGYCRSILLNAEDADDATQSALENALRALPRREPGRPLRPWLYRIAHNEAINIVRRRQPVADAAVDPEELLTVPGPEFDCEQRTRLSQLVDDLRMLPERQRGALVMRELSGLSYDEIGVALNVSNEAARRAVFDARSALHAAVDGRATECTSVRRCLSDGDRRRLRARGIRAHLRSCDDCRTFERAMGTRQADLHSLGPWIGGTSVLGLLGLGGGTAKAATLLATGGGGSAVAATGGGLGWGGLPLAVKGFAVAAVVASTGTAAVELPKVASPDSRAPQTRAATSGAALAPAAISTNHDAVREQALAQAAAARRARRARAAAARRAGAARIRTAGGAPSRATLDRGAAKATPAASAPAAAPPAQAVATAPPSSPAPAAAKTSQIAADRLERIREQMLAALRDAQSVADAGTTGALQLADEMIQDTLSSLRPLLDRVLATVGLSLPSGTTSTTPATTTSDTTVSNVLAPAQTLLDGVNATLQNLFGRR